MKTASLDLVKYGLNLAEEYDGWFEFKGGGWGPKYEILEVLESNMISCHPQAELENFDDAIQDKGTSTIKAYRYQFSVPGKRIRILARALADVCSELKVEATVYIPFRESVFLGAPHRLALHVGPDGEKWSVEKGKWSPSWGNALTSVIFDSKEIEDV